MANRCELFLPNKIKYETANYLALGWFMMFDETHLDKEKAVGEILVKHATRNLQAWLDFWKTDEPFGQYLYLCLPLLDDLKECDGEEWVGMSFEEYCWLGEVAEENALNALDNLLRMKQLVQDGDYQAAIALLNKYLTEPITGDVENEIDDEMLPTFLMGYRMDFSTFD